MTFAEKLIRLRKREGWSQEALARESGGFPTGGEPLGAGDGPAGRRQAPALCEAFWCVRGWILDDGQDWDGEEAKLLPRQKSLDCCGPFSGVFSLASLAGRAAAWPFSAPCFRRWSQRHQPESEWVHAYTGLGGFFEILSFGVAACPVLPGSSCGYSGAAAAPAAEENR